MQSNDIWQYAYIQRLSPSQMDMLLADGWRHFGTYFFRDMMNPLGEELAVVTPIRINLAKFQLSKHQKKLLRQNARTHIVYRDALIDAEKEAMFAKHTTRFTHNKPTSIYDFLAETPATIPCHTIEVCLYDENNQMYAVSFLDVGKESTSSIYAMFDPAYAQRSPGKHTILAELAYAQAQQKKYLYLGYAYRETSHYDYKKQFQGAEYYDWQGNWLDLDF
ncbi:MAG: arginine-tRNA-protein transferase [Microscillaceae bacterium]|jgi:arginine-tRNA-protein transferase|nr:arginine-tRNA-protein transferase [Microscillaceae bacterium]